MDRSSSAAICRCERGIFPAKCIAPFLDEEAMHAYDHVEILIHFTLPFNTEQALP